MVSSSLRAGISTANDFPVRVALGFRRILGRVKVLKQTINKQLTFRKSASIKVINKTLAMKRILPKKQLLLHEKVLIFLAISIVLFNMGLFVFKEGKRTYFKILGVNSEQDIHLRADQVNLGDIVKLPSEQTLKSDALTGSNQTTQQDNTTNLASINTSKATPDSLNVLVDKTHELPANYIPTDLVNLSSNNVNTEGRTIKLRKEAASALSQLQSAAKSNGYSFVIISGHRTYEEQRSTYNKYLGELGAEANQASALPGHSEHQLGTTVDLSLPNNSGDLNSVYPGKATATWTWLDQNAHRYGFVMSYRFGQEPLTGYKFEPWHWRYVGVDLATQIRMSTNNPQSFYHAM
jgi:D-alanyl-D-alanine carboxypeptidase